MADGLLFEGGRWIRCGKYFCLISAVVAVEITEGDKPSARLHFHHGEPKLLPLQSPVELETLKEALKLHDVVDLGTPRPPGPAVAF